MKIRGVFAWICLCLIVWAIPIAIMSGIVSFYQSDPVLYRNLAWVDSPRSTSIFMIYWFVPIAALELLATVMTALNFPSRERLSPAKWLWFAVWWVCSLLWIILPLALLIPSSVLVSILDPEFKFAKFSGLAMCSALLMFGYVATGIKYGWLTVLLAKRASSKLQHHPN